MHGRFILAYWSSDNFTTLNFVNLIILPFLNLSWLIEHKDTIIALGPYGYPLTGCQHSLDKPVWDTCPQWQSIKDLRDWQSKMHSVYLTHTHTHIYIYNIYKKRFQITIGAFPENWYRRPKQMNMCFPLIYSVLHMYCTVNRPPQNIFS